MHTPASTPIPAEPVKEQPTHLLPQPNNAAATHKQKTAQTQYGRKQPNRRKP